MITSVVSSSLTHNLYLDSPLGTEEDYYSKLEISLQKTIENLQEFAQSSDFIPEMKKIFGVYVNVEKLQYDWSKGNISLPSIEILSHDILVNARGAYGSSTNTIYLSDRFLDMASIDEIREVILEEFGHFVDAQINPIDTQGDEGQLFSTIVRKENISSEQLQQLKSENDTAIIVVQDQALQIEQSSNYYVDALLWPGEPKWSSNVITYNFMPFLPDDELTGNNVGNTLKGGGGNDTLNGNVGNDSLYGDIGNDLLIGDAGGDALNGGDGFDIASYSTAKTGITINLTTGVHTGDAAGDTFVSIEQITGSPYNDKLTGSSANDILNGAKGNDTLDGSDGDDILIPDWGDDVVNGGNGIDTLVIDYSTLPTQAVAWVDYESALNNHYVYVRNAWGIGTPMNTNLSSNYKVDISADGTTIVTSAPSSDISGLFVKKIYSTSPPVRVTRLSLTEPIISGNGSKVVWEDYFSTYGGGSEIWIANSDGTQVQ